MSEQKYWRIALGERALEVVIAGELDDDLLDRFMDLFVDLRNHERTEQPATQTRYERSGDDGYSRL